MQGGHIQNFHINYRTQGWHWPFIVFSVTNDQIQIVPFAAMALMTDICLVNMLTSLNESGCHFTITAQCHMDLKLLYMKIMICLYPVKVWTNAILPVGAHECLTVRLTVRSQWDHSELTATTAWWAHRLISQIGHSKLMVWRSQLWDHLMSALWGRWVASKWACHEVSCELAAC